jgi:hypothetical protein
MPCNVTVTRESLFKSSHPHLLPVLASAFVIFSILGYKEKAISFTSKSGELIVSKNGQWFEMDFPAQPAKPCPIPDEIRKAFKSPPVECLKSQDYIVVFEDETIILTAKPDLSRLKTKAMQEGIPYQTLINSILHKTVN